LITASVDRLVRVWDLESGRTIFEPLAMAATIRDVRFSPEGLRFVTACNDGSVRVWCAQTGRPLSPVIENHRSVWAAQFSKDGQRLFVTTDDRAFRIWDIRFGQSLNESVPLPGVAVKTVTRKEIGAPNSRRTRIVPVMSPSPTTGRTDEPMPMPMPDWLPRLIEAVARLSLDKQGEGEILPADSLLNWWKEIEPQLPTNAYGRVARWFMADRGQRTISPFSTATVPEFVQKRILENTPESLRLALWLDPTNALASARLAREIMFAATAKDDRRWAEADFLLRRAQRLAPADPEAWLTHIELFHHSGRPTEALAAADIAVRKLPESADAWNSKAWQLGNNGRLTEAIAASDKAATLSSRGAPASAALRTRNLLQRARLLEAQGRFAEAKAAEEEALGYQRASADWPSWGGQDPGRNMYSPAKGLPESFDPGKIPKGTEEVDMATTRNVKWIAKLGSQAYGNVVVSGGKIFVGTNNDSPRDPKHQGDRSVLMCFDEQTGAFLWQLVVPKLKAGRVNDWEGLGLTTAPTVVGDRVYVVTSRAEVLCLTTDGMARGNVGPFTDEANYVVQDVVVNGKSAPPIQPGPRDADIVWRYDMIHELGVFPHNASACALLVVGDVVFVNTGNGMDWTHSNVPFPDSPSFVALDRHTGKLLGEDTEKIGKRIFHASWNSPSGGKVNGRQLVFFGGGDGWLYAFDGQPALKGVANPLKTVWKCDCNPPEYKKDNDGKPYKYPAAEGPSEVFATPVFYKNRVYVATGQDPEHGEGVGNLLCIDATKTGDVTGAGIIWRNKQIHRSMGTVSIDPETGLLFVTDFSGYVYCIDAETGQTYWKYDAKAHIWPATLVADGKVFVGDEDGDFMIFSATKQKQLLSEINVGAPIYSTPIVANGVLFFQSQYHLYAVQDPSLSTTRR
jgi:outer membrane protein assembly factor BamB